ncbi:MAG: ATP-binding cassette domain-containing protein [Sphingobium sp.]|uniref:ATP-binding cassette domain-containing protein n=1 Tax=Sphingobium sp. TaxID=1912891 RepID=UPI0029BE29E3|nr:ATP-binding cassette domain-containing protein [Sphingobium sp.]MDX3910845.1 ATP-binding cassette domain-containing protein [Sphingobium sp.]
MSFNVNVSKNLGGAHVGATFLTDGGLTVLSGTSGAGKTSVLNMIAGLLRPDRGYVRVGDVTLFDAAENVDMPVHHRRLGYVFQDGRLFPHRRVRANLLYGYRLAQPEHRWIGVDEVVGFLGIGALMDRWPRSLSGGEAQRVAIGRALLSGPRALLMDEPLASLDPARRGEIMDVILRIRDELKLPILYVTHDTVEAIKLASHRVDIIRLK